ncbi:hypothetical protein Tco_1149209 [Tanacetum coccineum]
MSKTKGRQCKLRDSLLHSRNAFFASAVHWKSLLFMQFFRVLKKGNDFSADLDKNMFKLASFLLRLCTSFNVLGDCSFTTTSAFSGHALIPFSPKSFFDIFEDFLFRMPLYHEAKSIFVQQYTPWLVWKAIFPHPPLPYVSGDIHWLDPSSFALLGSTHRGCSIDVPLWILGLLLYLLASRRIYLGYFGWIATLIHFSVVDSLEEGFTRGSATILHSTGTMVLLCSVTIPSLTENLSIPCAVEGTAWIFLILGLLMIPLYRDGDRTTMKFI